MIVKAPFRISFFGGGTDFEDYYSKFGGAVLSTTINKYCYVTLRDLPQFFEYQNQFTYSKIERFNVPDDVSHPLVRNALKMMPYEHLQIAYDADLPACSGLGTSSAFAVALLQGLHAMRGEYPDKMKIAGEAVHLERVLCGEAGGVQDQFATAMGGFNRLNFTAEGTQVKRLEIDAQRKMRLTQNLLLIFTGFTRFSNEISNQTNHNIPRNLSTLHEMKAMVDEGERILLDGNLDDFGRLLGESWQLKRTLSENISNTQVDEVYRIALENGALGGKILGSGGGGFLLLYAPKFRHEQIHKVLEHYQFVPFEMEENGATLLYG